MSAMMQSLQRVEETYDGEVVAGCFPIPSGGRTVAIVEFIFCGICFLLLILAFVGSSISSGIFGLLFIIGLAICAFLLLKAVNDAAPIFTLPYIVAKIVHVICQLILVLILVGEIVTTSSFVATSSSSWKHHNSTLVSLGLVAAILNLLFHICWMVFGVIGIFVAFKVRNFFNQYNHPAVTESVVIGQPKHFNNTTTTTYYYDSK